MSKTRLAFIAVLCSLSMAWLSCNKEDTPQSDVVSKSQQVVEPVNLQISDYGFLVFENEEKFDQFSKFLETSTFGEVKDYFNDIGFKSLGVKKYVNYSSDSLITEEMMPYMILSESGSVLQIQNTILRPIEDEGYVLTLNIGNLNPENFQNLISLRFEPEIMNRYIFDGEVANNDNGLNFLEENPTGINEIPNQETPVSVTRGKIWKTVVTYGPCDEHLHLKKVITIRYRLWLKFPSEVEWVPC